MNIAARSPEEFLPLTAAELNILLALVDSERHGYGIMQEISARTNGKFVVGPATLYRALRRMLGNGLIDETEERPDPALDDERRRYYRLSNFGRLVLREEIERLAQLVRDAQAKHLFADACHDNSAP